MTQLSSVLGDLALLGIVLSCALGVTITLLALATRRMPAARLAGLGTAGLVGLYAVVLFVVSIASREVVLPAGAEKSVSGFDPHLHFRVTAPAARGADGLVRVTVRVRSDAKRALQDPRYIQVRLLDARGRGFDPVSEAGGPQAGVVFPRTLEPGEGYEVTLAFRPTPAAAGLRLWVDETGFPFALTIGNENSPLHRRTLLALEGV